MIISRDWLGAYVGIDCSLAELCAKLTAAGIEVEAVETAQRVPAGVVVARILERKPHPDPAVTHLSVCRVFDGANEVQIVCGAPNCDAGKTVPLATIGTVFKDGEGEFRIKKAKLRGVESCGMMCSARELGLGNDHDGLLELDPELKPGTPLTEVFRGDSAIEIEVTPNRPDWLSHWGVARDVACLLNTTAQLPEISVPAVEQPEPAADLVTVEAPELCPRYLARVIRGVRIAESPEWLKQRLLAVGLRPINNVVDVTNFVLMELGQPLHAFDLDRLAGHRVVARRARRGESITTLDGKTLTLEPRHLVIADAEKPMALAGVMGGEASGVSDDTVNLLIESAVFDPSNIRATSRELGISSDSSYRFERGVDFDMARTAADRAAQLILATAGGKLATELVEVSSGRPAEPVIRCRFDRVRSLIGVEIANAEIVDIFRRLRLRVEEITEESCRVTAPLFRLDLTREADLIEEVARIHGLDRIPLKPVVGTLVGSAAEDAHYKPQALRDDLIALGLDECMHYSTVSPRSALSDERFSEAALVRLDNPLSADLAILRPSLFGEMMETVARNVSRRNLDLRLCELSRVFCADPKLFPEERFACCLVLSGRRHPERFSAELAEVYDFYDLKGLLESLLVHRDYADWRFEAASDARFEPGRCLAILLDGRIAGYCGEVAHRKLKGLRTPYPVFYAELEAAELERARRGAVEYQPFSQFPAVSRDVAFVAPKALQHAEVLTFIRRSGLKFLEEVTLFDVFEDEKALGAGRRSLAYQVTFRHPARTLTDQEVNKEFEKLRNRLVRELKVELR